MAELENGTTMYVTGWGLTSGELYTKSAITNFTCGDNTQREAGQELLVWKVCWLELEIGDDVVSPRLYGTREFH